MIDFDAYIKMGEPGGKERAEAWKTAIGLQAVDGLKTSEYLNETAAKHIEGDITIDEFLCTTNYNYPSFHLTMHCYTCSIAAGEIELREHKSARWLRSEELGSVEWLPADKDVIDKLKYINN